MITIIESDLINNVVCKDAQIAPTGAPFTGHVRTGLLEAGTSVLLTFFLARDIVLSTPPAGLFPSAFDIVAETLPQLGVLTIYPPLIPATRPNRFTPA